MCKRGHSHLTNTIAGRHCIPQSTRRRTFTLGKFQHSPRLPLAIHSIRFPRALLFKHIGTFLPGQSIAEHFALNFCRPGLQNLRNLERIVATHFRMQQTNTKSTMSALCWTVKTGYFHKRDAAASCLALKANTNTPVRSSFPSCPTEVRQQQYSAHSHQNNSSNPKSRPVDGRRRGQRNQSASLLTTALDGTLLSRSLLRKQQNGTHCIRSLRCSVGRRVAAAEQHSMMLMFHECKGKGRGGDARGLHQSQTQANVQSKFTALFFTHGINAKTY